MLRYIALLWDAENLPCGEYARVLAAQCAQDGLWKTALESSGCTVLWSGSSRQECPQRFSVGKGVIFGRLFHNPGSHPDDALPVAATALPPVACERVISSGGRELIQHYWGDYVAIFREWSSSAIRIVRSPSATLNCLHTHCDGVDLYCSDLSGGAGFSSLSFSINWRELVLAFVGPQSPGRTHLHNVREIIPGHGERIFRGRITRECLWNPAQIARAAPVDEPQVAARALRTVTRACIQARASEFPATVMSLSGGLDSSITLACLTPEASSRRVICLNQYGDGDESDERDYARLAAARARCELHEHNRSEVPDLRSAIYRRPLECSPGLRIESVDRVDTDFARSCGARAIFYGHGGDELFLRTQQPLYVSDFLRTRGFRREVFGLLLHAAHSDGVTVWRMLARCLMDAWRPRHFDLVSLLAQDLPAVSLLRAEVLADLLEEYRQRLALGPMNADLGPGRRWQLFLLGARRSFASPFDRPDDPTRIAPLLSQPIVELCLRIPTWFQMRGRRDRALARDAFSGDVPQEILARRDKGGAESLAALIVQKNLPFLREMLFDGLMARSHLIDRDRLEAVLADAPSATAVGGVALFDLLGAEIWAQACSSDLTRSVQNSALINK